MLTLNKYVLKSLFKESFGYEAINGNPLIWKSKFLVLIEGVNKHKSGGLLLSVNDGEYQVGCILDELCFEKWNEEFPLD